MKQMLLPNTSWAGLYASEKAIDRLKQLGYEMKIDWKNKEYFSCQHCTDPQIISLAMEMKEEFYDHRYYSGGFYVIEYDETQVTPVFEESEGYGDKRLYFCKRKEWHDDYLLYFIDWNSSSCWEDYDAYWEGMEQIDDDCYTVVFEFSPYRKSSNAKVEPAPQPECTYQFTAEEETCLESFRTEYIENAKKIFTDESETALDKRFDKFKECKRQMLEVFKQHPNYNGNFTIQFSNVYSNMQRKETKL